MVIYIKDLWVIESYDLNFNNLKDYSVYDPKEEKVLFTDNDINKCIKYAEMV